MEWRLSTAASSPLEKAESSEEVVIEESHCSRMCSWWYGGTDSRVALAEATAGSGAGHCTSSGGIDAAPSRLPTKSKMLRLLAVGVGVAVGSGARKVPTKRGISSSGVGWGARPDSVPV